ncbi:AMP-binding protein [Azohydromonas caseinilytica]|uniref:AMP-binding protein n=1 Tax=Azohydromonas caseinilytica TaxID=2728836 RepID=A0A848FJ18_9BURK|nr:AMP-binding protein [Azohydromonas caseinilytica]NML18200.1 AMP-binding protein [Azohydromonas caseinilytica]
MEPSLEPGIGAPALQRPGVTPARLMAVIGSLMRELHGGHAPAPALDDDLQQALGIDSLARMELMLRLEQSFGVRLPEAQVQAARTPRELLHILAAAPPADVVERAPSVADMPVAEPEVRALPRHARTLAEVLQWHADKAGARRHVLLLYGSRAAETLTHAELLAGARDMAGALQRLGPVRGEAVALMLPTSLEFLQAFMGILLAGGIPVPIYPPLGSARIEDHLRRQLHILSNAGAVLLISDRQALAAARLLRAGVPRLRAVLTPERLRAMGGRHEPVALSGADCALIQYTSGSTGQPKGVVLTHANLLANIRAMGQALQVGAGDLLVSWLPLYHDMGLIGAWLGCLYHGVPLILMPPQAFLGRPSRWLKAISDHRATLSAAPNFAYEVLATKVPDAELQGLDLRCWRAALNGAEPVQAATLERFAQRLRPFGFDARAMLPVYGLAECGVGLAFPPPGRGARIDGIDRLTLQCQGRAAPVAAGQPGALRVVGCGMPLPGHELRVVDGQGAEVADRREGRIEFRGPSATAGYFGNPAATGALFHDGWLDSGDLGYVADGELFLTSRVKDLIIRGGHNLHPYDLEAAVSALPGIRRGCVAVFGAPDPATGTERIVVVAETRAGEPEARAALRQRIARLSLDCLGLPADEIVLAGPHAVLKTSSGKIRRAACRDLYERGLLDQPQSAVAGQLARLWGEALLRRLRERGRRAAAALFGARAWAAFGIGAGLGALAALLPGRRRRKHLARALARAVLRAGGLPLRVRGAVPEGSGPWIFVSNHASYLDWLVLTAVLPAQACLVAKRELRRHLALGWVLARMGVRFVTRDDSRAGVEDTRQLARAARDGESLVFFPEGTLGRAPGLQPFHLGAFAVAAQSGLGVVPTSLTGTRSVLRDGSWWPRAGAVEVTLHEPLLADGQTWESLLRLRDAARERVAQGCREPLLSA